MTLCPPQVLSNLQGHSFINEFTDHEEDYLSVVVTLHQNLKAVENATGLSLSRLKIYEEGEVLVALVASTLLSPFFPHFRKALRCRTLYCGVAYQLVWARSMARYVVQEAIKRDMILL